MAYTKYSLTPANNTAAPPDGAPEGMLPSAVNDTMRDMMAQIRDVGDGIRDGTYTMTAPKITGGTITGSTINNSSIGATTASTGKFTAVTNSALTSGRVTYAGTAGVLQDDADFTFNGTTVTMANDASISGLTVGKGGGAVATNVALGQSALAGNSTGLRVTAVGNQALLNNTASENTGLGARALLTNTSGANNTAVGRDSMYFNTTGGENAALGLNSLLANTTGSNNTAIGRDALQANTTASNNTAVGYQAGYSNTTGVQLTALGYKAAYSTTTAEWTTALGYQAGTAMTTGSYNCFVGGNAGAAVTTGLLNTFIGGINSGSLVTTGSRNTIIGGYNGNSGGLDIRTASNYIVLSDGDGNPRVVVNPSGYTKLSNDGTYNSVTGTYHEIRNNATSAETVLVTNSNASFNSEVLVVGANRNTSNNSYYLYRGVVLGVGTRFLVADSGNVTNTNGSYGTISDIKNKENIVDATPKLDKLKQLKVRNFNFKGYDLKQIGFVAQEFEQVFPSMVEEHHDKDADNNDLGTTTKSIKTSVLVPILVKAVQELTAKVEALEAQLNK